MSYDPVASVGKTFFGGEIDLGRPVITVPHYWLSNTAGPDDFSCPAANAVYLWAKHCELIRSCYGDVYTGILLEVADGVDFEGAKTLALDLFNDVLRNHLVVPFECGCGCLEADPDDEPGTVLECWCPCELIPFRVYVCERGDDGEPAWGVTLTGDKAVPADVDEFEPVTFVVPERS